MGSTESALNNRNSAVWVAWFKDLQQSNTFLGGIARSCKGSDSAPLEVGSGKISFIWDSRCTEKTIDCLNTGAPLSCMKAFSLCSGVEAIIDPSTILERATAGTEGAINLTKNSIQALSTNFFSLCNLPSLPQIENTQCQSLDRNSLAIIGVSWIALPHIINYLYEKKDTEGSETLLAKSISKGLIVGPIMAWAFNQNLYTGAVAGIISAWAIDSVASYTIQPVSDFFSNILRKDHIARTFERQKTILKYGGTLAALSICYAHVGSLIPFINNSPYSFANLPISITLATGTFIFILKYPVTLLEGIFNSTKNAVGTLVGSPEIPLIAYSSLYLTLYKEKILDFTYNNLTYENCLGLYNNTSRELLNFWNKGSNLEFSEEKKVALFSLTLLGIFSSALIYRKYPTADTKVAADETLAFPPQQAPSAFPGALNRSSKPDSDEVFNAGL